MNTTRTVHSGPAAVYVMPRFDRRRFQLGWSLNPLKRAKSLSEYTFNELDLANSVALWLPDEKRAIEVERCMHLGLAPYRIDGIAMERYRVGHAQWFSCGGLRQALGLLQQMPAAMTNSSCALMAPFLHSPPEVRLDELAPVDAWWGLQYLLLRVSRCLTVRMGSGALDQIILQGFRHADECILGELRTPVVDIDTYQWRHDGKSGSFVSLIHYDGDDLVLTLNSPKVMACWREGSQVASQVGAFVHTIRQGRHQADRPWAQWMRRIPGYARWDVQPNKGIDA